jgi:MarR family transcriptional regulator for hemolysin
MISDRSTSADVPVSDWHPLGRDIVFLAKEVRVAFEGMLARAGGSLGTWVVLSALTQGGLVPQKVLASHVHIEGATMTHHLDRLEAQGLVRRVVHSEDRRVRHVEPTAAGKRLYTKLFAVAQEFDRAMTAGLGDADKAELRRLLGTIAANVAALGEQG